MSESITCDNCDKVAIVDTEEGRGAGVMSWFRLRLGWFGWFGVGWVDACSAKCAKALVTRMEREHVAEVRDE